MTASQARSQLPVLFNRMATAGAGENGIAIAGAFIDWLYKNGFEIVSFKERKARREK